MILKNLTCGFISGSRAGMGSMGRKLAGLCGASILLDISSLSSIPLFKAFCFHMVAPNFPAVLRTLFPPSKLTSRVLNGWPFVFLCYGCHHKVPPIGWLKQKFVISQFWNSELQNQGVSRVPCEGCEGRIHSSPLSLACGCSSCSHGILPVSSHGLPSVLACVQVSPLYKNTSHVGLKTVRIVTECKFMCPMHSEAKQFQNVGVWREKG